MPRSEWWAQVQTCTRLSQWLGELAALGMPQGDLSATSSYNKVGQLQFSRVQNDGSWSDADLQQIALQ